MVLYGMSKCGDIEQSRERKVDLGNGFAGRRNRMGFFFLFLFFLFFFSLKRMAYEMCGVVAYVTDVSFSYGGREASLEAKAKREANQIAQDGKSIAEDAKAGAEGIIGDVKQKAGELKQKVVK